jgi:hypothetical protein
VDLRTSVWARVCMGVCVWIFVPLLLGVWLRLKATDLRARVWVHGCIHEAWVGYARTLGVPGGALGLDLHGKQSAKVMSEHAPPPLR